MSLNCVIVDLIELINICQLNQINNTLKESTLDNLSLLGELSREAKAQKIEEVKDNCAEIQRCRDRLKDSYVEI